MDKGANRLQWELSADFDSENPARFLPPGRRSRGSDPGIPNLPQIILPGAACQGLRKAWIGSCTRTAAVSARRRAIP